MISQFQFHSYKVDSFTFKSHHSLEVLARNESFKEWQFRLGMNQPIYFERAKQYVCFLGFDGRVIKESEQDPLLELRATISGMFTVRERFRDKALEETLVKIQGPSLLLPYLRSAVTSYVANAGFGTMIFPLINVHQMAEDSLEGIKIKIQP